MLAGGQVDGKWLGIEGQNGNTHFLQRFALRAHAGYDPLAAMKFALGHQNPFVTSAIIGEKNGGVYPETNYSLLTVSSHDVLLWALKPNADGIEHGVVTRQWNLSSAAAKIEIAITAGLAAAHQNGHGSCAVDRCGTLTVTFNPQQMQTYRLDLK